MNKMGLVTYKGDTIKSVMSQNWELSCPSPQRCGCESWESITRLQVLSLCLISSLRAKSICGPDRPQPFGPSWKEKIGFRTARFSRRTSTSTSLFFFLLIFESAHYSLLGWRAFLLNQKGKEVINKHKNKILAISGSAKEAIKAQKSLKWPVPLEQISSHNLLL